VLAGPQWCADLQQRAGMCQVSLERIALLTIYRDICQRDHAGKDCEPSKEQINSAFCVSLTKVPLGPLASVVCVRLHEVTLMVLGSVYPVYLPAVQHVVASLQPHLTGVWADE